MNLGKAIITIYGAGYAVRLLDSDGNLISDSNLFDTIEEAYRFADRFPASIIPDGDRVGAELQEAFVAGRLA